MSSVNSADKEKFESGSFSELSCKEKSWREKSTFSFTGFWKWQFLWTLLQRKKLERETNFFFYRLLKVAVSLNYPVEQKQPLPGGPHIHCGAAGIQILQILQNLPIFENARPPSLQAAFGENPKWQFLESWVAISRKLGGNFSKVGWQFLEPVESVENLLKVKNPLFKRIFLISKWQFLEHYHNFESGSKLWVLKTCWKCTPCINIWFKRKIICVI